VTVTDRSKATRADGSRKQRLLITFGEHAREFLPVESFFRLVHETCKALAAGEDDTVHLMGNIELLLIGLVNPDGRRHLEKTKNWCWRGMANMVDVNRNCDWHWGGPGSRSLLQPTRSRALQRALCRYQPTSLDSLSSSPSSLSLRLPCTLHATALANPLPPPSPCAPSPDKTFNKPFHKHSCLGARACSNSGSITSEEYRGTNPFSEPETRFVRDVAVKYSIDAYMSMHTGAQVYFLFLCV